MNQVLGYCLFALLVGAAFSSPASSKVAKNNELSTLHHHAKRQVFPTQLTLSTQLNSGLVAIYNSVQQVGVVFDVNADLILLFSSQLNQGLLLDAFNNIFFISNTNLWNWWLTGQSLANLPDYLNQVVATDAQIQLAVSLVVPGLFSIKTNNINDILAPVLQLKANVAIIVPLVAADVEVVFPGDAWRLANIIDGVVLVAKKIGVSNLQAYGVTIPLDQVLIADTGVKRVAALLKVVVSFGVPLQLLSPLLDKPQVFLYLSKLGGGVLDSTPDGFWTLVTSVIQVYQGTLSAEILVGRLWIRSPIIFSANAVLEPLVALAPLAPELVPKINVLLNDLQTDTIAVSGIVIQNVRTHLEIADPFIRITSVAFDCAGIVNIEVAVSLLLRFVYRGIEVLPPLNGIPVDTTGLVSSILEAQLAVAI